MEAEIGERMEASQEKTAPRVDLNLATAEELEALPGIGPELAKRILNYRQSKGPFLSTDEILAISGIGPVLYDRIADRLTVTAPEVEIVEEAIGPPEEALLEAEVPGVPEVEAEAPRPAAEEVKPAPSLVPEAPPARKPDRAGRFSWLWGALLGGLLGMICTLLILSALNGSLILSQTPVIMDLDNRIGVLSADLGELRDKVSTVEKRLEVLEGLPARMDTVEDTVAKLQAAVGELDRQTKALDGRVDAVEEDLTALGKRADKVDDFFQQLQSLLADVFGPTPSRSK